MTRIIFPALVSLFLSACDFAGLCPSDPCADGTPCPGAHVCAHGQCVLPCDSESECPAGRGGSKPRCLDPQGELGFSVCADNDGVPGQLCEPDGDGSSGGYTE